MSDASGPDHSIYRYRLPHPISAAHKLAYGQHDPAAQLPLTLLFAQEVFRFLALVGVADGLAVRPRAAIAREWFAALRQPGIGVFLHLIRDTAKVVREHDRAPFLAELEALLNDQTWQTAVAELKDERNRFAHNQLFVPTPAAQESLGRLAEPLRVLLQGIVFLQEYQLGWVGRTSSRQFWHPSRGVEETSDPIRFVSQGCVFAPRSVVLLSRGLAEALELTPLLRYGVGGLDGLVFLDRLAPQGEWREGVYRHPTQRQQEVMCGLASACELEQTSTVSEFLAAETRWPRRLAFDVDADFAAALGTGPRPPGPAQGRFEFIGRLGAGGMGEVWEVYDRRLCRRCALKRLRKEAASDFKTLERFEREGKLLAKLEHPRVVEVYDFFYDDQETPCLLLELIKGEDLQAQLDLRGPLERSAALGVLDGVLEALGAIHEHGVLHRDLKPGNVVLTADGPRLIDFGIAYSPGDRRLTSVQAPPGTPGYIAPERHDGEESERSDLYAAGCLLHALLVGEPPKRGKVSPKVPADLVGVLRKALHEEPGERYASAVAMRAALSGAERSVCRRRWRSGVLAASGGSEGRVQVEG